MKTGKKPLTMWRRLTLTHAALATARHRAYGAIGNKGIDDKTHVARMVKLEKSIERLMLDCARLRYEIDEAEKKRLVERHFDEHRKLAKQADDDHVAHVSAHQRMGVAS